MLKDSAFETSDQRRKRRRLGLAKARAAKGGKVSAKARRALLSENDLSPARCPPVYVCVPMSPPSICPKYKMSEALQRRFGSVRSWIKMKMDAKPICKSTKII